MSHYEERLENDLSRIRDAVGGLADSVLQALRNAMRAVLENDKQLANETVIGDQPINRESRRIDRLCHAFIARHLPSAGHLRLMSSIIRANVALERIGDYAVTVSREALQLPESPPDRVAQQMDALAGRAFDLLADAVTAFNEGNVEAAKTLMSIPEQLESGMDEIYEDLIDKAKKRRLRETVAEFVILSLLKRVSDQAKNICDQTVFSVSGEIKEARHFEILFVDKTNSVRSQMAEAIAAKRFPASASYSSAGREPADAVSPNLIAFLDERGIDAEGAQPRSLEEFSNRLQAYDIIVRLDPKPDAALEQLPFHTVLLEWDTVKVKDSFDDQQRHEALEENYRNLSVKIEELMHTLVGEDAA